MKSFFFVLFMSAVFLPFGCTQDPLTREYPQSIYVTVENTAGPERSDQLVSLDIEKIKAQHPDFNPQAFLVLDGKTELASQVNDLNQDGQADQVVFVCDLSAGASKSLTIRYAEQGEKKRAYTKRTQAELSRKTGGRFVKRIYEGGTFENVSFLRVPLEHTDHSWYIRYEGPGWESDKVGYRFYLDWRNATDIFGKKVPDMVLQNVGQDGFDSYHEMSGWGMDVLKVGESLGIGSIAMWQDKKAERVAVTDSVDCRIVSNGPVQSKIRTRYFGWESDGKKYDLTSCLTIDAGSRLTRCDLNITGEPENLCTGIVKLDSGEVIVQEEPGSDWQYLATWGRQSLANDLLGMAVLYPKSAFIEETGDDQSHVIVLKPAEGILSYYFLACWEKEPGGITSKRTFVEYIDQTVDQLDHPVTVTVN